MQSWKIKLTISLAILCAVFALWILLGADHFDAPDDGETRNQRLLKEHVEQITQPGTLQGEEEAVSPSENAGDSEIGSIARRESSLVIRNPESGDDPAMGEGEAVGITTQISRMHFDDSKGFVNSAYSWFWDQEPDPTRDAKLVSEIEAVTYQTVPEAAVSCRSAMCIIELPPNAGSIRSLFETISADENYGLMLSIFTAQTGEFPATVVIFADDFRIPE